MPATRPRRFAESRGLALFLALMFVFRSAWADWMVVPSGSMNPTIIEGDRVLVDKHAFGLRVPFTTTRLTRGEDPARGDIPAPSCAALRAAPPPDVGAAARRRASTPR